MSLKYNTEKTILSTPVFGGMVLVGEPYVAQVTVLNIALEGSASFVVRTKIQTQGFTEMWRKEK
jgi:hypothetical protein